MRTGAVLRLAAANLLGGLLLSAVGMPADAPAAGKARLRRPVALVLADDGKWLFAANQRSGTISVIDTAALRTVAEVEVGSQLTDLALTARGSRLLAVDEGAGEVVL